MFHTQCTVWSAYDVTDDRVFSLTLCYRGYTYIHTNALVHLYSITLWVREAYTQLLNGMQDAVIQELGLAP